jgi:hypothetical protein
MTFTLFVYGVGCLLLAQMLARHGVTWRIWR